MKNTLANAVLNEGKFSSAVRSKGKKLAGAIVRGSMPNQGMSNKPTEDSVEANSLDKQGLATDNQSNSAGPPANKNTHKPDSQRSDKSSAKGKVGIISDPLMQGMADQKSIATAGAAAGLRSKIQKNKIRGGK